MTNSNKSLNIRRIAIEVFSVVFAVLVALAVDEAWEDRENMQIADEMEIRIKTEIQRNLVEIEETHTNYVSTLDTLSSFLSNDSVDFQNFKFNLNLQLAVLTSAAWSTAQILEAVNYMDHDWVIEVAEAYELQKIYIGSQNQFLESMSQIAVMDIEKEFRTMARIVVGRLFVMNSLQAGMIESYKDLLEIKESDSPDME